MNRTELEKKTHAAFHEQLKLQCSRSAHPALERRYATHHVSREGLEQLRAARTPPAAPDLTTHAGEHGATAEQREADRCH